PKPLGSADDVSRHPYLLNELLTKILPHLTVRSNVFAVYLTVGFFEVRDDTAMPPRLGAEITPATAGNDLAHALRRRRMFAVVDRTNLALANPTSGADTTFRLRQAAETPFHLSYPVSVPEPAAGLTGTADIPVPAATACTGSQMTVTYEGNTF